MKVETEITLKNKIINLREKNNWSQSELAKLIGIDNSMLSKIESGVRRVSASELEKFSTIFGVTTDYLLGRNDTPEWASNEEAIELDRLLKSDSILAYNDGEITEEDKEIINNMLAGYFWSKKQKEHK